MTKVRKSVIVNNKSVNKNSKENVYGGKADEMQKTDSIVNLTKPTLYSIYDESSMLNLNKDDFDTENVYSGNYSSSPVGNAKAEGKEKSAQKGRGKLGICVYSALAKVIIVTGAAWLYNEITRHIHKNHIDQAQSTALKYEPLYITTLFINNFIDKLKLLAPLLNHIAPQLEVKTVGHIDSIFGLTLQGLVMSSVHPLMDKLLPSWMSNRLLSSNPNPKQYKSYANALHDSLRSLITFLGISYAIRNIEWNSFLQMSIIWSLLNPGLWLLLDGTLSGLLSSSVVAFLACLGVYAQNLKFVNSLSFHEEFVAIWLWIASFFFCGLIIFGKLGRVIFGR